MKKIFSMMMVVLMPLWVISGCDYGGGGGGDGGNGDGNGQDGNGGDSKCTPHDSTMCAEGVTYWKDSCGNIEEVKEMCGCGCNATDTDCEDCTDLPCQSNADCPTGWACDLGTNKCKQQGCTSNSDCPSGFFCNASGVCERESCVPDCAGKCCGDNGCDGTCPNACVPGEVCDLGTCQCKPDVTCTSNDDCPPDFYCDMTVNECKPVVCTPQCEGKCCGDDGCGNTCPSSCSPGYTCNMTSCQCVPDSTCTSDSQCPTMHCCRDGNCVPAACGNMQCGYDYVCEFSCGTCPAGTTCDYQTYQCVPDGPGDLCPAGQSCEMLEDGGRLGCLAGGSIPAGNPACSPDAPCDGNFSCFCLDVDCTEQVCIENCGTCPTGLTCWVLWDGGPSACLTAEGSIPPNTPNCNPTDYSCAGNATCYQESSSGNLICLGNCSAE